MRFGIFHKIIAIFIVIIIISFLLAGGMLYFFMDDFFIDQRVDNLKSGVNKISEAFENYLISYNEYDNLNSGIALQLKKIVAISFDRTIKFVSDLTGANIWIVTNKGQIWKSYPELPSSIRREYMDNEGLIQLPEKAQYMKLLKSDQNHINELGDFYGFFSNSAFDYVGNTWLSYGEKFYLGNKDETSTENVYLIYMHMPASQINITQQKILRYFVISIIFASFLALIMIYLITKKLTYPIKQMNKMSKVIASGEFSERLDISSTDEIGELAHSFNQMIISLEKIEEMRQGFVSNVSHELRTPMTTIKGFVQGILDGTIPKEKHTYYLNIVKDEIDRLSRLINDLLTLSRLEAGGEKPEFNDFDIQESIRRCVINLESYLLDKDLDVNIRFCKEYLYVHANKDSIEQVIYNLLHNAIKFSHPKGIIIVATRIENDLAHVTIEDFGIGMQPDELEKIWDRFYTVDKSKGMDDTGTGLGLSIIKNVMDNHNQPITVVSEPGRGTKFAFTLQLAEQEEK